MAPEKVFQQAFVNTCHRMYDQGLVTAYDGNLSGRYQNHIYMTPTHLCKKDVTVSDLIQMQCDGTVLSQGRASSEKQLHLNIYATTSAQAVCHAHPVFATLLTVLDQPLDPTLLTEAQARLQRIAYLPAYEPGSASLAAAVASAAVDHDIIVLARHGVITYAASLAEAYYLMESVERLAHTTYHYYLYRR